MTIDLQRVNPQSTSWRETLNMEWGLHDGCLQVAVLPEVGVDRGIQGVQKDFLDVLETLCHRTLPRFLEGSYKRLLRGGRNVVREFARGRSEAQFSHTMQNDMVQHILGHVGVDVVQIHGLCGPKKVV